MAKILVTGGAGYIGSILVPYLLHSGHIVVVLDNFMYNQSPLLDYVYSDNLVVIKGDVRDIKTIQQIVEKYTINCIFPLACLTGEPLCQSDPTTARQVIFHSIEHLLLLINPDIKIIYPNTNSGYGIGGEAFCTEESPLKPISLYGTLKCSAEQMILDRGNSCSLRLATAFGASPRMRLDLLVNDFVYRAVKDRFIVIFEGHFRRNYVHVRDIARAFMHCLENWDTMKDNVYNLGNTSANCSKLELCQTIQKQLPDFHVLSDEIGKDPDKRDYVVSNKKLEKTGWKPLFSLDFGVKELIRAYQIIRRNQYANI